MAQAPIEVRSQYFNRQRSSALPGAFNHKAARPVLHNLGLRKSNEYETLRGKSRKYKRISQDTRDIREQDILDMNLRPDRKKDILLSNEQLLLKE